MSATSFHYHPTLDHDTQIDVHFRPRQKDIDAQKGTAYNFTYEHGRRYPSKDLGQYYLPNDSQEIKRLNDQHLLLTKAKGEKLHNAPLSGDEDGFKILDVGCGTGLWCIQMAVQYPNAKIFGMDISPIQPEQKPSNIERVIHDMEQDWPFPEQHFDLIHASLFYGSVADFSGLLETFVQ